MAKEKPDNINNQLASALQALRHCPIPPEPPADTLQKVLQAAEKNETFTQKTSTFERVRKMNNFFKIAAALVIVISIITAVAVFQPGTTSSSIAWSQVIQPILNARTAVISYTVVQDGRESPPIQDQIMGSRIRRSMQNIAAVSIIDLENAKILTLDPDEKKATYIDLKGLPSIPNYLETLRNVINELENTPGFVVEELGEKQIDGRNAVGFAANHPRVEIIIWADTETALPIRIEQKESKNQLHIICFDIEFDREMDEADFSMEVPPGYSSQQTELDLFNSTEADFIEYLRIWAQDLNDSQFPEDISVAYVVQNTQLIEDKYKALDLSDEEELAHGMKFSRGLLFLRFFKGRGTWHYAGNSIKFGDAQTPVFWYQPQDSDTFRVIYGDLHIADLPPEDLHQTTP